MSNTRKKRMFISFDYDNDAFLKDALVGQAKNPDSPFDFVDASVKQHLTGDWKEKVRGRIQNVDVIAVICGEKTDTASGVAAEVMLAQEEGVPYFFLKGYAEKAVVKPVNAMQNDKLYTWTWDNLKILVNGGR